MSHEQGRNKYSSKFATKADVATTKNKLNIKSNSVHKLMVQPNVELEELFNHAASDLENLMILPGHKQFQKHLTEKRQVVNSTEKEEAKDKLEELILKINQFINKKTYSQQVMFLLENSKQNSELASIKEKDREDVFK